MRSDDVNLVRGFTLTDSANYRSEMFIPGEWDISSHNLRARWNEISATLSELLSANLNVCARIRIYVTFRTSGPRIVAQLLRSHETKCATNGGGCETSRVQYFRQAKVTQSCTSIACNDNIGLQGQVRMYAVLRASEYRTPFKSPCIIGGTCSWRYRSPLATSSH
jgi:hypothetical protein